MSKNHHHSKKSQDLETPESQSVSAESPANAAPEILKAEKAGAESAKTSAESANEKSAKSAESPLPEISAEILESAESPEVLESAQSLLEKEIAELKAALELAQKESAVFKDQFLRAKAESENTRRRAEDEIAKARKFALEGFAKDLLAPWDSLEAALNAPNQSLESLKEGLALTKKQLDSAFQKNALLEINPLKQKFDPHQNQAVGLVPSDLPKETVAVVLQKGFLIAERVLRPAMVMISNGENPNSPA